MVQEYKHLYYGDAIANAYFWDKEDDNFACCFLIKKTVAEEKGVRSGAWSSVNLFDVTFNGEHTEATFKLVTTVIIEVGVTTKKVGDFSIMGNVDKKTSQTIQLSTKNEEM